MKTCFNCYAELTKDEVKQLGNVCADCEYEEADVVRKPKKKDKPFKKSRGTEAEMFRPEDEGKTWFNVPSPYKAYKK